MEQIKTISLKNEKTLTAIKFVALLGLAILAPIVQNQLIKIGRAHV